MVHGATELDTRYQRPLKQRASGGGSARPRLTGTRRLGAGSCSSRAAFASPTAHPRVNSALAVSQRFVGIGQRAALRVHRHERCRCARTSRPPRSPREERSGRAARARAVCRAGSAALRRAVNSRGQLCVLPGRQLRDRGVLIKGVARRLPAPKRAARLHFSSATRPSRTSSLSSPPILRWNHGWPSGRTIESHRGARYHYYGGGRRRARRA